MSLRSQIHHAIDDVAPPSPTLERRVKAAVLIGERERRPARSRWVVPLRGTLGLVGVALLLALVAGLFIGGRFWRNENAPPSTVNQTELKSLESRPLNYPAVAAGTACPTTPLHLDPQIGMVVGDGPVYLSNGDIYEKNDWGFWVAIQLAANQNPGLVLIRARDLKSNAQVAFAKYPLEPTPMEAVGAVLGTSRVADHDVQMRAEAAVPDISQWPKSPELGSHVDVIALIGMQNGSSGCIGFQMDGAGFSENFVVQPGVAGV